MNNYRQRQELILKEVAANSVVYLFSGSLVSRSADSNYKFSVDRNFYYLTGIDKDDMVLELSNFNGVNTHKIYALEHDELYAKWIGNRMSSEEIKEISGVDIVENFDLFEKKFTILYNNLRGLDDYNIYLDLYQYKAGLKVTSAWRFYDYLNTNYHTGCVKDIYHTITKLRLIKDEVEVNNLIKANEITNKALVNVYNCVKPGINEKVLHGNFILGLMENGCDVEAFDTIVASGKNATCLHYVENNKSINDGDLVLLDLGATYNNYCADISRTIPVNGKFSPRQKELYEVVLNGMDVVIANAKEGKTLTELNNILINYYEDVLPKVGLNKPVNTYYYHGVSHFLGLDTHDVDLFRGTTKLKAGMVITVEPGLYVEDEGLGIRIEDDILITKDEPINLSEGIIKTVNDIELFFAKK